MNKKIKNLFLAGALVLGLSGVAVSCTDYDDDINKLQTDVTNVSGQVSTLQSTVNELQNKINAGFVITSVTPITGEPGGYTFTTSDGKSYEIKNGAKGADGKDGAQGPKGDKGDYYTPNAETGTWMLHTIGEDGKETVTDTEQSLLPEGFINVEFDADTNTLTITAGEEEFTIELNGSSASFVFVPQAVVDGRNAMEIKSFASHVYVPVDVDSLDSKGERWAPAVLLSMEKDKGKAFSKWVEDNKLTFRSFEEYNAAVLEYAVETGDAVREAVPAIAQYHVNYDVPLDETYEYSIVSTDVPVYTRVESSADFAMSAEFVSYENGILSVEVAYVGTPAGVGEDDNHMTQFALQVSKGDKVYTSDYATFVVNNITAPKIADPRAVVEASKAAKLKAYSFEEHYRRGVIGLRNEDWGQPVDYFDIGYHEYFASNSYVAPWTMSNTNDDAGMQAAHATCDTAVAYDETLDLRTITIPHYDANGEFCFKPSDCCDPTTGNTNNQYEKKLSNEVHKCLEMSDAQMAEFGLHFEYEVVQNYLTDVPETDQADFVELVDGHIFKPRVYETEGTASIGRTPIIRVKLMHGEDIVNVAYIKVFIAQASTIIPQIELVPRRDYRDDESENIFHFNCDGDSLYTTVHDMNVELYNPIGMNKKSFHLLYDSLRAVAGMKDADGNDVLVGTIEDVVLNPVEGTHVIKWKLTPGELWAYAGEEVSVIAEYYNSKSPDQAYKILLRATVGDDVEKTIKLSSAKGNYINERWTSGFEATKYNVLAPAQGDTMSTHAEMVLNINSSFQTDKFGKVYVDKAKNIKIDSMIYYFCKPHVEEIAKIDGLNVKFFVEDPNDKDPKAKEEREGLISVLKAAILDEAGTTAVTDTQVVAVIINDAQNQSEFDKKMNGLKFDDAVRYNNVFVWAKKDILTFVQKFNSKQTTTTVADSLINAGIDIPTGYMYTYIGAKAFLCTGKGEEPKELDVTFDGNDHFRANILRPVSVTTKSADGFIDAVNFGEPGSYIKIEDLLDPIDWRDYKFVTELDSKGKPIAGKDNAFLWKYYGPFKVVVDTENIECDFGGVRGELDVNLVIRQTDPGVTKYKDPQSDVEITLPENESGYLTYKNNGVNVTADFNLYVKAKVGYGFGWIDTDWITVPVAKTVGGQNDSSASGDTPTEPTEPTEPETPAEGDGE